MSNWALKFDGVNDYLLVPVPFDFTGDFYLKIVADMHPSTNEGFLELSTSTNNFFGKLNNNTWYCRMSGSTVTFNQSISAGKHTLEWQRIGSTITATLDGDLKLSTTFTAGSLFDLYGRLQGGSNITGNLYGMEVTTPEQHYLYEPDSSDRSGSTSQPILTDTVGGNDATGVGFPAFDPSVWVNLGGSSLTISPSGIVSTVNFGSPSIFTSQVINPSSVVNINEFGFPLIAVSPLILPTGIDSTFGSGTPNIVTSQFIEPSSITSTIAFGLAELKAGNQYLVPISIDPTTEFGLASIYSAVQYINANGIPSGIKYGRPVVTGGAYVVVKSYTVPITTVIFKEITRDIVGN